MSNVTLFMPQAPDDPREICAEFVRFCKQELTVFGRDLKFSDPVWDVTDYVERKGDNSRMSIVFARLKSDRQKMRNPDRLLVYLQEHPEDCLLPEFADLAKSYLRYMQAQRPIKALSIRVAALKVLDEAIRRHRPPSEPFDVVGLNGAIYNEAAQIARQAYSASSAYGVANQLELLAKFMTEKGILAVPLIWRNPLAPPNVHRYVGRDADKERERKLPSQEALDVIADVFHRATTPRDLVTSGCVGLLLSAPMRIHELLLIPAQCEIFETTTKGKPAYGLRWRAGKGADPEPKWLSSEMAPVAKKAIREIEAITKPGRKLALWYQDHPNTLYLPPELENLRGRALNRAQISNIMGIHKDAVHYFLKANGVDPANGLVPFNVFERIVIDMLPNGFPWASKELRIKYSDAMFVVPLNLMHASKATCPVMFQLITRQMLKNDLSGPGDIFERHRAVGGKSKPVRMNSHQARHLLNTLALTGGMSQLDTAKWSGRKDIHQNRYYDHRTPAQALRFIRGAVGDSSRVLGPLAELPQTVPISKRDFAVAMVPTAHTTEVGWCIHDYATTPCELFNDCIGCEDHICIKGELEKNSCARELLRIETALLGKARQDTPEHYGAGRWEVHHALRVARLRALVEIYDDEQIPNGTVIQVSATSETGSR